MFLLRWQRWAACPPGAPCTGRCRTRACAATASVRPTPARAVPCWTKPCPTTSCSAAPRRTTARCPLAWSTTRRRPTCAVSTERHVRNAGRQGRSSSVANREQVRAPDASESRGAASSPWCSWIIAPLLRRQSGCRCLFEEPLVSRQYH